MLFLTFEMQALLLLLYSKLVRYLVQWDLRDLETLGALSSVLATLRRYSLSQFLNRVIPWSRYLTI